MTKLPPIRDRSVVRSSVIPSARYSWSGSLLRLVKGSTTIDRGGGDSAPLGRAAVPGSADISGANAAGTSSSRTSPTKRTPLREKVRIRVCVPPLSPSARRAAAIRLSSAASETMRPPHTDAKRSSLLTTRSRFCSRWTRRSNTCGSSAICSLPRLNSRRAVSSTCSPNRNRNQAPRLAAPACMSNPGCLQE